MSEKEDKALWIEFAKAAIQSYEIPEDIADLDELVDDIGEMSAMVADEMLDQFNDRFSRGSERRRPERETKRGRGRSRDEGGGGGRSRDRGEPEGAEPEDD